MRAIVMTGVGGPDVLVGREVPEPVPGPREVLLQAEAIGVHFAETQMRAGVFPMPDLPAVLGGEAGGTVIEVGPGVDRAWLGRTVIVGTNGTGSYAERVVASMDSIVAVPEGLSVTDAVAAAVPAAVAIVLLRTAAVRGGEVVLVEAAASGVGAYITQLAKEFGAGRVIGTAGSLAKREHAERLGADDVVDHSAVGWQDSLRELLGEGTIDVVFESIGGSSAVPLLDLMTPLRGRMLVYGLLTGRFAAVGAGDLLQRGLTLQGCGGTAWLAKVAAAKADVLDRVVAGTLTPLIDSELPLEHAHIAHERIENHSAIGKILLVP
jgi:NADPH:quinone reductase